MYNASDRPDASRRASGQDARAAPERFDALILGAGISGLVAASVLLQQGVGRILVVDDYAQAGGNHIDRAIGDYTFDIGSFIFQDDSPLLRHFPELLAQYVPIDPRWGRLNPQGVVTRYPISLEADLVGAGPVELGRILASALAARLFQRRMRNARDFARRWIGERLLQRSGLADYMERFYGLPPEQIDLKFAEKRMLWIKEHALLRTHLRRLFRPSEGRAANTQLARPREGFAALYRPAVAGLEARGVSFRLDARMRRLEKSQDGFTLSTAAGTCLAGRVVSTIPLEHAQKLCGLPVASELSTVTLISLFFSFQGRRGFDQAILYNFSHEGAWKRLTVYSDFYGPSAGREFFAVEVNADHVGGSLEAAERDFRAHARANGLFAGDLRLEGGHVLANAYPVYADDAEAKVARAVAALAAFGVETIGRQGRFDYQPTARDSTLKAEAALAQDRRPEQRI
jgi:protoporphyrinogen oxidase